jgi:hypothetical protein
MVEMELNEGSRVIRRAYCVLVLGHVTARFQRDGRLWESFPVWKHIISYRFKRMIQTVFQGQPLLLVERSSFDGAVAELSPQMRECLLLVI